MPRQARVAPFERFAMLRPYADAKTRDVRSGLQKAAAQLTASPLSGKMVLVTPEAEGRPLLVDLDMAEINELTDPSKVTPDFVVFASGDTIISILRGELSPLEALATGNLRYAGNEDLGVAILRELATSQDAVFEPCREEG
jgi:hypothetical protein